MSLLLSILRKIEHALTIANRKLARKAEPQYRILEQWYMDDPHALKRSTFEYLDQNSIVFDLGGYEGQWTSDIYSRYQCNILVFEPVKAYAQLIEDRFRKNNKIQVFQMGLAHDNMTTEISINAFASSVMNKQNTGSNETITLKKFSSFLLENKIHFIDLVKINIEGSEYDLMDHLLKENITSNINGILIQFHNFADNANERMTAIQTLLSKTHHPIFQYPFIWEYWEKKRFTQNIDLF